MAVGSFLLHPPGGFGFASAPFDRSASGAGGPSWSTSRGMGPKSNFQSRPGQAESAGPAGTRVGRRRSRDHLGVWWRRAESRDARRTRSAADRREDRARRLRKRRLRRTTANSCGGARSRWRCGDVFLALGRRSGARRQSRHLRGRLLRTHGRIDGPRRRCSHGFEGHRRKRRKSRHPSQCGFGRPRWPSLSGTDPSAEAERNTKP